jgi:predicted CopG family antitoxin
MQTKATKTIRISVGTHQDLEKLGTLADSFDSVIQELLNSFKKNGGVITKR